MKTFILVVAIAVCIAFVAASRHDAERDNGRRERRPFFSRMYNGARRWVRRNWRPWYLGWGRGRGGRRGSAGYRTGGRGKSVLANATRCATQSQILRKGRCAPSEQACRAAGRFVARRGAGCATGQVCCGKVNKKVFFGLGQSRKAQKPQNATKGAKPQKAQSLPKGAKPQKPQSNPKAPKKTATKLVHPLLPVRPKAGNATKPNKNKPNKPNKPNKLNKPNKPTKPTNGTKTKKTKKPSCNTGSELLGKGRCVKDAKSCKGKQRFVARRGTGCAAGQVCCGKFTEKAISFLFGGGVQIASKPKKNKGGKPNKPNKTGKPSTGAKNTTVPSKPTKKPEGPKKPEKPGKKPEKAGKGKKDDKKGGKKDKKGGKEDKKGGKKYKKGGKKDKYKYALTPCDTKSEVLGNGKCLPNRKLCRGRGRFVARQGTGCPTDHVCCGRINSNLFISGFNRNATTVNRKGGRGRINWRNLAGRNGLFRTRPVESRGRPGRKN